MLPNETKAAADLERRHHGKGVGCIPVSKARDLVKEFQECIVGRGREVNGPLLRLKAPIDLSSLRRDLRKVLAVLVDLEKFHGLNVVWGR